MTVFTVDLGPALRERAEREGSKFIQRPMHIGRLSAKLTPGVFVVEDLVIEGLSRRIVRSCAQEDRRLGAVVDSFSRKLIIESIAMTDWDMVVEILRRTAATTSRSSRASRRAGTEPFHHDAQRSRCAPRGQFTYEDHGTPWSTVARNLTVQVYRSRSQRLRRHAPSFSNGTVRSRPTSRSGPTCESRFKIDGGKVHFDHMDLIGDGSRSTVTGDVDLAPLARADLPGPLEDRFPDPEGDLLPQPEVHGVGQGDFTGTFICSRAAAS